MQPKSLDLALFVLDSVCKEQEALLGAGAGAERLVVVVYGVVIELIGDEIGVLAPVGVGAALRGCARSGCGSGAGSVLGYVLGEFSRLLGDGRGAPSEI